MLDHKKTVLSVAPDGRRLGGTWEFGQLVTGIAESPEATPSDVASAKRAIDMLFQPGRATVVNGVSYGWLRYDREQDPAREHPQAEAALWPIIAISALLSQPGALDTNERERFVQHLQFAEDAASLYYSDGYRGWMNLPNQKDKKVCGL